MTSTPLSSLKEGSWFTSLHMFAKETEEGVVRGGKEEEKRRE